jgi:PAS domain S-box-containing protein
MTAKSLITAASVLNRKPDSSRLRVGGIADVGDAPALAREATQGPGAVHRLLDPALFADSRAIATFLGNVLDASTEYSIIGEDLDGKIELWNEGARRNYGYEPEEVIGKANASILNTVEDVAVGLPLSMTATALKEGKYEGTLVRRRKNDTTFTARVVLTPRLDNEEIPIGFLLISKDVSDEIRLNQELKAANAELLEASRHKTEFLASMSHELRTPLNSILGFSELLIDSPMDQFPVETRTRFLEQIHSSGEHLLGIINDILDLSKVEAGQMELRLSMVSVAEIVSQVANIAEPLAARKAIHIEVEASRAGRLVADGGKLKQMILNLVSNAIKFTQEGGTVTINSIRAGDRLQIVVSDNGIGIAEQDLPRLFKEFQQLDSGINRAQQGTGLGLALTRSFANLHGGDVRVESILGEGSRFTIDIPLERGKSLGPIDVFDPLLATASDDPSRPLVLVVEDDPAAAELLARQIQRAGFRPKVARTGAEALTIAQTDKPAAITLDIMLPDMDGWEVLKRLKDDEVTNQIPAIVVSVVDNPELGVALGTVDYFVKPLQAKALVKRLSTLNLKRLAGQGRTSVLIVDDEPANRDWLKQVLEPAGFDVTTANGGREGIELAKTSKPDIVMLDLIMPDVDGFEVIQALSAAEETKTIPIVVLTAKHLTNADLEQLNDRVSSVLKRGSTGAIDVIGQLQVILNKQAVAE